MDINATIDMFFTGINISDVELRERAEAALNTAQRAKYNTTCTHTHTHTHTGTWQILIHITH